MINKWISKLAATLMIGFAFLLLLVTAGTGFPEKVQAAEENQTKVYVTDDAGLFKDSEKESLEKMCKEKSDNCKTDIVIITQNKGLDGSSLDSYIKNILNTQYGYNGTGSDSDAVCYVIDMGRHAVRIVTSGSAQSKTNQSQLQSLIDSSKKKLTDQNYYGGCTDYLKRIERYLNPSLSYKLMLYFPIKLLIAAGVAVISVLVMMFHAKAKMTVSGNTYARGHHGNLRGQSDRFINTTVVRHRIQTNHGNGGGGGGGGGNSGSAGGHF